MVQGPYEQLFVYEVDGDLRPWAAQPGPGYLGLWLEGKTSYLFFAAPAAGVVERLCRRAGLQLLDEHQLSYEQWQGGQDLVPLEVGPVLLVPPWQEARPRAGQRLLRLDPGLVFGNGLHPTTGHCLQMLTALAERGPLGRVLDLGCGSGILGLVAAALGAAEVTAVDLNPLCVATARRNAELNHLELEVIEGRAQDYLARPAELLLANLHWQVIKELLADPAPLEGKRHLIISGITRSQVGELRGRLRALGWLIEQEQEADFTWFSLLAAAPLA